MTYSFVLSAHAVEKHLEPSERNASAFFSRFVMNECVEHCLHNPDMTIRKGKRVELIKQFPFAIGLSRKRESHTIKVVYTKSRRTLFVITAYPIKNEGC